MQRFRPTGATAEPATVRALVSKGKEELRTAPFAGPQLGALPSSSTNDEEFIIPDSLLHAANAIAAVTTRVEIGKIVVGGITVQVVNDEGTTSCASSATPLHSLTAPMARMRTPTESREQHPPLLCDLPVTRMRQRMAGVIHPQVTVHQSIMSSGEDAD